MKLFDFIKNTSETDIRELEIYSGMRVIVETPDEELLFVAKLQEPYQNTADLYQYSASNDIQNTEISAIPVIIRGYNDRERKAIYMTGSMTPKQKHIWQVKDLIITKVENERAFSRLDTDITATITPDNKANEQGHTCTLLNISAGGASIESERRYYKGDRFLLKAKLIKDAPLSVIYCEILRVAQITESKFEYGCRFLELTEADQEKLSQSIALLAKNP